MQWKQNVFHFQMISTRTELSLALYVVACLIMYAQSQTTLPYEQETIDIMKRIQRQEELGSKIYIIYRHIFSGVIAYTSIPLITCRKS